MGSSLVASSYTGAFVVRAKVFASPTKVLERVEEVAARLEADGWKTGYATGGIAGVLPQSFGVAFRISKLGSTPESAVRAVELATRGGFFSGWSDFKAEFAQDVVNKTGADAVDLAKRTGQAAERAAFGIGTGIGLALVAVVGIYALVVLGPGILPRRVA